MEAEEQCEDCSCRVGSVITVIKMKWEMCIEAIESI